MRGKAKTLGRVSKPNRGILERLGGFPLQRKDLAKQVRDLINSKCEQEEENIVKAFSDLEFVQDIFDILNEDKESDGNSSDGI